MPIKIERPATQKVQSNVQFDNTTMYNETFQSKKQARQVAFPELPSFAYSILYPDRTNPVDKISFKNAVHSGEFAARRSLMAPKGSTVKIGTEGDHDHITTSNEAFTNPVDFKREQPIKRNTEWKPRQKFTSKTQAQDDFKSYGKRMPSPRKAITPPPETIDLAVDNHRYLETTNNSEHRVTWEKNKLHRPPLKKMEERYTPPKQQFQGLSVMREDFPAHKDVKSVMIKQPDQTKPSNAKFFGETSYMSQFPKYDNHEPIRHGDPYEKQYYVKPLSKFVEDDSTMRDDFKNYGHVKPVSAIRPENKQHAKGDKFFAGTSYREEYTQKTAEACTLSKLLAENDSKKLQLNAAGYVQSKSHKLPNVRKPKGIIAATY